MDIPANIFLIGPMGAGKSTIGRRLASALDKEFVDADHALEQRTGVDIPLIFELEGEAGFRKRESELLATLVIRDGIVLATGGGVVLSARNRASLAEHGFVIYLEAPVELLVARVARDRHRPLMQTPDPKETMKQAHAHPRPPLSRERRHGRQVDVSIEPLRGPGDPPEDRGVVMRTVEIDLGARRYPIHVGAGIIGDPKLLAPDVGDRHAFVVTNETVAPLHLDRLRPALAEAAGIDVHVIADGERHKTLDTFAAIQNALVARRVARDGIVLALGGGVVGDVAGFAAACYQRGVDFVQVPTTLLAQVDSSVGGKTGVNLPGGKNLVGAFHQPRCVLSDTRTLATLDPREVRAGFAEIVKYGLIDDPGFFDWLEANVEAVLALDDDALGIAIVKACERKAALVVADERESGVRALLNLGHTFAHAIETGTGYGAWLHGEAVAAGIVLAAHMSSRMGWLAGRDCERIERLLDRAGLPTRAPAGLSPQRMLDLMSMDKKVRRGRLRLILLRGIGEAVMTSEFDPELLHETLETGREAA